MLIGWYLDLLCFPEYFYLKIVEDQEKASALAVQISVSRSTGHKSEVYSSAIHGLKLRIFFFLIIDFYMSEAYGCAVGKCCCINAPSLSCPLHPSHWYLPENLTSVMSWNVAFKCSRYNSSEQVIMMMTFIFICNYGK